MSDFGILLSATKKNGDTFSLSEKSSLSLDLKNRIKNDDYRDMLGDLFQHQFEPSNGLELIVQLSEHYFGDEDPSEAIKFVEENEYDDAKRLATKMSNQFAEILFVVTIEEW